MNESDCDNFIEAARTLLNMAMFHYWLRGGEADPKECDTRQVIDDMHTAFVRLGIDDMMTYEQYRTWLETKLHAETVNA